MIVQKLYETNLRYCFRIVINDKVFRNDEYMCGYDKKNFNTILELK